jgi:serine/threonine-protein kinase
MASERSFGKYRPVAELGHGGMADVILALAQGPVGFNKLVVIKRLRAHLAEDPEFVAMLVDEARLAARLNHPNIVHTNEVGEIDGRFFIAMEHLEGQPLVRVKRRATRTATALPLEIELRILADVLAGLHYAHELADYDGTPLHVVHRDMTPSNVFVTYEGVVKIVDFGIAKAIGRTTETKTGVVKGKTTYMPPEQALGREVDRRADVYSVGVMLWEAATGRRMWKGLDDVVILGRLISGDIPVSPRAVDPDVPEALDAMCRKALAADPDERFASAVDLQNELEAFLDARSYHPTSREIGKLVNGMFEAERREIKTIIEGQLSKLKEVSSLEPVVIPDSLPAAGTPSSTEISPGSSAVIRPSFEGVADAVPTVPPERARRAGLLVLVAVAAAALALALYLQRDDANTPTETSSAQAPQASAAQEATRAPSAQNDQARAKVRVTLRAVPASARFSIDGGRWLDNPYVGEVSADDATHEIRIDATGHEPKTVNVRFDNEVLLDVSLKQKRPRYVQRPPPPATSLPSLPPPPPAKKPEREIFTGDPWED